MEEASAGARAFESVEAERRLLCEALAQAIREVIPGAALGPGATTETGFTQDFLSPAPFGADRLPVLEAAMHGAAASPLPAFRLAAVSGAYQDGDESKPMLTRITALAFASQAELEAHLRRAAEAEARDHRRLGRELAIFAISEEVGRGLPLLLPKGAAIRLALERFIVDEETARGYELVYTPVLGRRALYERSGHLEHYAESMYPPIVLEGEEYILRPMTCPHHFMLYRAAPHSYRDLPVRYAEISPLYRRERSGELYGLARLMAFHLADSHIMCRADQVGEEFDRVLELVQVVMRSLGFESDCRYRASLGEPGDPKYGGSEDLWEKAEATLLAAVERAGIACEVARGEAAFYGPKLDVQMRNVRDKEETLFTIQIDFLLPGRFELTYTGPDGRPQRPVVIHRSSVGCLERTIAFLLEKYAGALPPWLAPVQVRLLPVAEGGEAYAREAAALLRRKRLRVDVDGRGETLARRVRDARAERVPYVAVVGRREAEGRLLAVRNRDTGHEGSVPLERFARELEREVEERALRAGL